MPYILPDYVEQVRKQPGFLAELYSKHGVDKAIRRDLGPTFANMSDDCFFAAFACITAFDLAAYRTTGMPVPQDLVTLRGLLDARYLVCNEYCRLTALLFRFSRPNAKVYFDQVGWNGLFNHAQLFFNEPGKTTNLMLDPNIATVIRADYDTVARGIPIGPNQIVTKSSRANEPFEPPFQGPQGFREEVKDALLFGKYRPSFALYFIDAEKGGPVGPERDWCTPQAVTLLRSHKI